MTKICKREVVKLAVNGCQVPYVPWHCSFTHEASEKLVKYLNTKNVDDAIGNHFLDLGSGIGFFENIGGVIFL
jgi:uroporphyrinogen decarboxylase